MHFHKGYHFSRHHVFVIYLKVGAQEGARIALVALPTPIRERHRQVGRAAVVELLVFVGDARQDHFLRDRRPRQRGGRRE